MRGLIRLLASVLGVAEGELVQKLVQDILSLINNDAEVYEGEGYITIHPRHSYDVGPVERLLGDRGFELVGRKVFGDPRTTSNVYDYYEKDNIQVILFYAKDMLVFRVIRDIRIKTPG